MIDTLLAGITGRFYAPFATAFPEDAVAVDTATGPKVTSRVTRRS